MTPTPEDLDKTEANARAEQAEADRDNFKTIGKQLEQDARKHFDQSCINLQRAEQAERDRDQLGKEVRAWREVNETAQCVRKLMKIHTHGALVEEAVKVSQKAMEDTTPIRRATDASGALDRAGGGE